MSIAELRAQPWGLWWTQIMAVLRLELRKNFLGRRSLWIYPLVFTPALLTLLHSIFMWHRGEWDHGVGYDSRIFAGVFQYGYLRLGIYFGCVILFMNLFRGEVLNRTLHYYFLAPIRREVLAAGKYLSALVASSLLFAGSVAAAYVSTFLHFGPQFEEFFFQGEGLSQLAWYVTVTLLACIGYGAVFLVMGLLFRNPMIPAAIVMVWENINTFLPSVLKKISVVFYLKSLCPVDVPESGMAALLGLEAEPTSAWVAIPGLLLLAAATLVYAGYRARRMQINYAD
ncbi:MAG: ABC transporter permease subunit [bacterium]|nr:ABC transporter permease subunit [bacterium]